MAGLPLNPLLATLAVTVTLLLCALVPKALRDVTMLLRYNAAQLEGSSIIMNSARQMSTMDKVYVLETGECPESEVILASQCKGVADAHGIGYNQSSIITETPIANRPAGCFLEGQISMETLRELPQ